MGLIPPDPTGDSSLAKVYEEAFSAGATVVVEDLYAEDSITLVNTSQGIIGFAICRDVLDLAGVGNPLERYLNFVDHIMVISFNEGVTWLFEAQGEDLARWHNYSVSYINSKQALPAASYAPDTNVVMGFCMYPYDQAASGITATLHFPDVEHRQQTESMKYEQVPANGQVIYVIKKTKVQNV